MTTQQKEEGAIRYDAGKLRIDLVPAEVIVELARVYTVGAQKYEPNNWKRGMSYSRCLGSLKRHLTKWELGHTHDEETGCHELAHVMWNAATLLYYELYGIGNDDRDIRGTIDDSLRILRALGDNRSPRRHPEESP